MRLTRECRLNTDLLSLFGCKSLSPHVCLPRVQSEFIGRYLRCACRIIIIIIYKFKWPVAQFLLFLLVSGAALAVFKNIHNGYIARDFSETYRTFIATWYLIADDSRNCRDGIYIMFNIKKHSATQPTNGFSIRCRLTRCKSLRCLSGFTRIQGQSGHQILTGN